MLGSFSRATWSSSSNQSTQPKEPTLSCNHPTRVLCALGGKARTRGAPGFASETWERTNPHNPPTAPAQWQRATNRAFAVAWNAICPLESRAGGAVFNSPALQRGVRASLKTPESRRDGARKTRRPAGRWGSRETPTPPPHSRMKPHGPRSKSKVGPIQSSARPK
jgi:hypothetical protein